MSAYDSGSSQVSLTSILIVSSFGSAAPEWQNYDLEDIVFFIPPDCPTSTPVAPRKRASSKSLAGLSMAASAGVDASLATTRVIEAMRH